MLGPTTVGTPDRVHTVPLERFPQTRMVSSPPIRTLEEQKAWLARHNVQPQTPLADPVVHAGPSKLVARVEMMSNCAVVPIEIDGHRMLAVLDTGMSSPLRVLRWTGDKPVAQWEQTHSVSWEGMRTQALAPDPVALTIGGYTVTVPAVYTLDPDEWVFSPFDAVIGWSVLEQWSWSIDFEEGVFRFAP